MTGHQKNIEKGYGNISNKSVIEKLNISELKFLIEEITIYVTNFNIE